MLLLLSRMIKSHKKKNKSNSVSYWKPQNSKILHRLSLILVFNEINPLFFAISHGNQVLSSSNFICTTIFYHKNVLFFEDSLQESSIKLNCALNYKPLCLSPLTRSRIQILSLLQCSSHKFSCLASKKMIERKRKF